MKLALAFLLCIAALLSCRAAAAKPYAEGGYFSVDVPSGWERESLPFGHTEAQKKIFGFNFFAGGNADGIPKRISVHYYAPGNMLYRNADQFIRLHSRPVLPSAEEGESYGPVRDGRVGKYPAKLFDRTTIMLVPPRSIDQKRVPVAERFAVVPAKEGFYVLQFSAPADVAAFCAADFDAVLSSFGMAAQ